MNKHLIKIWNIFSILGLVAFIIFLAISLLFGQPSIRGQRNYSSDMIQENMKLWKSPRMYELERFP